MKRILGGITVIAALSLLAIPSAASARAVAWGGIGFNDLGPASALLSVNGGRASVTNVQLILACTDAADGTESSRAFDARYRNRVSLRQNRFAFDFTATSGGRVGRVRVSGTLGSRGTGTARVRVEATATGEGGAVVERCGGEARITLRRGA